MNPLPGNVISFRMRRYVDVPCTTSLGPGNVGPFGHQHNILDVPHSLFVFIPRQKSWLPQTIARPSKLLEETCWQFNFIVPSTDAWILRVMKISPVTNWYSSKKKPQNITKSRKWKQDQIKIITDISYCIQHPGLEWTNHYMICPAQCIHPIPTVRQRTGQR